MWRDCDVAVWALVAMWLGLASMTLLVGCSSLIPMKRSEQEGMKASQQIATEHELTVRKIFTGAGTSGSRGENRASAQAVRAQGNGLPAEAGTPNLLELHDVARVASQGQEQARAWYKQTVPVWVTLCGCGVGIIIIVFAVKYARRSSPAIDAAFGWADQEMAGVIRGLKARAAASTDHEELADLNGHVAELEAARGRIAARRGSKQ